MTLLCGHLLTDNKITLWMLVFGYNRTGYKFAVWKGLLEAKAFWSFQLLRKLPLKPMMLCNILHHTPSFLQKLYVYRWISELSYSLINSLANKYANLKKYLLFYNMNDWKFMFWEINRKKNQHIVLCWVQIFAHKFSVWHKSE